MDSTHHIFTSDHYSPRAADYLSSAVHAEGPDLDQIEKFVAALKPTLALDIGCGGGHVAYRVAPHAGEVVACDISDAMLQTVRDTAAARGLANLQTQQAPAERLPFADGSVACVLSRFSAHHWPDMPAGLREARRVLAPGGRALFADSVSPSSPLLDSHLQAIELLRDASHVRNYRVEEWVALLAAAGFAVESITRRRLRMDFAVWVARTRTPPVQVAALRAVLQGAPAAVAQHFAIEPDGSWMLDTVTLEARPF